jgi:cytochrome d ubiquinol oxidase subunit II
VDVNDKSVFPPILPAAVAIAALVSAAALAYLGRSGRAFAMTAIGTVSVVATLFVSLYPRVMVSNPSFENSLTVENAASAHYTLAVMSVIALITAPLVLLYQAWSYHVFRGRIGVEEPPGSPVDLLARKTEG